MFEGLFQPMHLIVILIIVLVVFGPGKLPEIGGALGKGIREFKRSTSDETESKQNVVTITAEPKPASANRICGSCHTENLSTNSFCGQCGARLG
ncbi:MAG: twin-arginine translocase TatA/TatE family subunit [Chloroflexi bacterium]|nr:twin-arginine translocase TatA/TatE family subunit [Chloroflexota bacterium]